MRPSAPLCGVLLGAAVAIAVAACAGPRATTREPAPATADAAGAAAAVADPRRNDITVLWEEIREFRRQAGLPAEPTFIPDHPSLLENSVQNLRVCPNDPQPDDSVCRDVCTLKEHICDNAEDICRIAGDLGGDPWADEKCQSAKASCKEATEKCCACAASGPAAPAE